MINKALALILALLIGNPLCCCALALQISDADTPVHSCCAQQADPSNESEEEKKPCQCPCDKDGKALSETHEKVDAAPAKNLDPHHVWLLATEADLSLPRISTAAGHIAKWPPGRLPIPSMGERLASHCSYLL
ncbi:MAG: hypothetical protein ACSHX0_06000 [Akkermansiaceae bacterium]